MDNNRAANRPIGAREDAFGRADAGSGETLGDTISGIIGDMQQIVRGEVQLAKTEIKEDAGTLGKALGMIAAAALVGLVGFIFLMLGVTYLLNKSLEMWLAAGIVGVVLLIIAVITGMVGKNRIQEANLKPQQTIESVKEDKEWASRQINSVKR
jgi:uncharacterized membrane protein YqjE